jgi:acyl carrier protein
MIVNEESRMYLKNRVRAILADRLGIDEADVREASLLGDDLGLDSFDALRMIFEVEDEFGIKVPPADLADVKTVEDVIDYLSVRISGHMG